ncbi:MAG: hypothetical protein AAF721_01410 [Myxococcota bacterium]
MERRWIRLTWMTLGLTSVALLPGCPNDADDDAGDESVATESGLEPTGGTSESSASAGESDASGGLDDTAGAGSSGGAAPVGAWHCLGAVEPPGFEPGQASVTFTVVDFPAGTLVADAAITVCRVDDVACDAPASMGSADADGEIEVAVPTDVPTYYEVEGTDVVPSIFFRRGIAPADPSEVELGALAPMTLGAFVSLTGAEQDPARGSLVLTARDCDEELAQGVEFEVGTADEASTYAYLEGMLPSAKATQTDASGRAGVLNLPEGPVEVTARLAATGDVIGVREIFIRPGELSLIGVIPN